MADDKGRRFVLDGKPTQISSKVLGVTIGVTVILLFIILPWLAVNNSNSHHSLHRSRSDAGSGNDNSGDGSSADSGFSAPASVPQPTADMSPKLKVSKWHWHTDSGFAIAEGTVTNLTGEPLKDVEAVVSYQDRKGTFITAGEALTEYDPILPGQTSPWKTMATYNPEITNGSVEFKDLTGGTILSQ